MFKFGLILFSRENFVRQDKSRPFLFFALRKHECDDPTDADQLVPVCAARDGSGASPFAS